MTIEEYNKCVDEHADAVYRFIFKNIKDEDRAKDIVQDAFEKMWIKAESVEGDKAKSYLFTTAYRTMIDEIRKHKNAMNYQNDQPSDPSNYQPSVDLSDILQDALNQLPEQQRSMVMLRDYEGYSYEEISEILDVNVGQVKVYLYRARKFLQQYIGSIEKVI